MAEHTGISEKDYEAWTGESLNLKDAEVHVVYQRERSERNDLGIDYGTKTPEIYAGMMRGDLWNYVAGVDVKTSDFDKQYTIVSKEDRILTGVFEDSKWEHIIVFSDEHFEELKAKADGANLTVMLNVSEQEEAVASEINDYMNKQNEKQKADGNREFLLYEKNPLLLQSKQSHVIQVTIIVLNVIILVTACCSSGS